MTKQAIDTDRVAGSINALKAANERIDTAFDTLKGTAGLLENNWNGKAGECARTTLYELFKLSSTRYGVLQEYANLLEKQVNPGYIAAEESNTKLADKFR